MKSFLIIAATLLSAVCLHATTVAVKDQTLLVDGRPTKLWGIRVASASQTPELTQQLIANLDDYRANGINAIAVYYMGSLGAYSDPFSPDGRTIDAAHQARMDAIVRACDARGIIAIVGVFYQRSDKPNLKDWNAARAAVRTAATALRAHPNVIFNIANEQSSEHYKDVPWQKVQDPAALIELCREAKAADPARIVGAGGYHHANNEVIGRASEVEVLLFDTKLESSGDLHRRFLAAGVRKPMINVEIFGGWTKQFQPPGVYTDEGKREHLREIAEGFATEGLHIFFHSSPWLQGTAEPRQPMHFELGGKGTAADPGIRWFFERVKAGPAASLGTRTGAGAVGPKPSAPGLTEPLTGKTSATVRLDPGQLTPEGWKVTSPNSQLCWDLGRNYARGTVEFEIKGDLFQEEKRVLIALWNNPEGAEIEPKDSDDPRPKPAFFQVRLMDEGMLLRITARGQTPSLEKHTGVLSWGDSTKWVKIKATFDTKAGGLCQLWRDGVEIRQGRLRGNITPGFRYVFLGRDNYGPSYVAVPGYTFRNLRIYDLQ